MAQQVLPSGHAPRTEDCQGSDGPQYWRFTVLDVAPGLGLRAVEQVRLARGSAGNRPGVQWITGVLIGHPAPLRRGIRSSNHDCGCDRRDGRVGLSS